jgi:hypothetical protein
MGPLGHFSVGLAAKPVVPKVPLGVLFLHPDCGEDFPALTVLPLYANDLAQRVHHVH